MPTYTNIPHDGNFMELSEFIANRFATAQFGTKDIAIALQAADLPYAAHPRICAVLNHMTSQGQLERVSRSIWRTKPAPAPVEVPEPEPEPAVKSPNSLGTFVDNVIADLRRDALAEFDRFMDANQTVTRSAVRAAVARILETTVR